MAWIELDGAVNVRDLGGLPTRSDGQTVSGRLLRSDNLQELSAADVARLVDDIGLTTVIDLRSTAERTPRARRRCRPPAASGMCISRFCRSRVPLPTWSPMRC